MQYEKITESRTCSNGDCRILSFYSWLPIYIRFTQKQDYISKNLYTLKWLEKVNILQRFNEYKWANIRFLDNEMSDKLKELNTTHPSPKWFNYFRYLFGFFIGF